MNAEPVDLLGALDRAVAASKALAAQDPAPVLPDLSDALHGPDGTLLRTSVWSLAQVDRLEIIGMARRGRYLTNSGDYLVRAGYAVEYTPGYKALTDAGAHLAWHAADGERGLHRPLHDHWATNAEARRAGLDTYQPPVVLFWDGEKITEWRHP